MNDNEIEAPLRVAIYLRVSTDEQVEKYGLSVQRASIDAIFKTKGKLSDGRDAMVLAGEQYIYEDDGISGTVNIRERPAFARLMEDLENAPEGQKPFDAVAVYKIDRLARRLKILLDVLELFKTKKVELISATESIDTSTPYGRAMLNILGAIAELERETIRERTTQGRERANLEGKFMGKSPKYGYKKDEEGFLVILEDEAKIVRDIFRLFVVNKLTPQQIADKLTEEEVPSSEVSAITHQKNKGKGQSKKTNPPNFWRGERTRSILSDEVYIGHQFFGKYKGDKKLPKEEWKRATKDHEPIILDNIFELAQKRLEELANRKLLTARKEQGHLYLLSSLLKCDHCKSFGEPETQEMMSWTGVHKRLDAGGSSYYYGCNRKNIAKFGKVCTVVPIPAEPLEKYVTNFVVELISNPKSLFDYQEQLKSSLYEKENVKQIQSQKERLSKLLSSMPKRRNNLLFQHAQGYIDNEQLKAGQKDIDEREKKLKGSIGELDFRLSKMFISEGYKFTFEEYSNKYSKVLDTIVKDRKELYNLIHTLIYQIVIYSRPTNKRDKIAGRKKEGQMIPNKIDIHLNLPQNLLQELYTQRFVVKNDNV